MINTDIDNHQLCPGCFSPDQLSTECGVCGYQRDIKRSPVILPHYTNLNGRFIVGRVIGKPGGFGITYLGMDLLDGKKVAIKEFLPRDISGRDSDQITVVAHSHDDEESFSFGMKGFLQEARTLALMDHPNLVRILDFFEANRTAYIVMQYYDGLTLSEYLSLQPSKRMMEAQAIHSMIPILDGLKEVHKKGFLHRDIKPHNIYLTTGNRPILLDFGAARQSLGDKSKSLSVVLSEGYAPIEQYQRNAKQGPWTDIYGVAATLYEMVSGIKPPSAMDRLKGECISPPNDQHWSKTFLEALSYGMMVEPDERCRSVEEFQTVLLAQSPIDLPRIRKESPRSSVSLKEATPKPAYRSAAIASFLVLLVIGITLSFSNIKPTNSRITNNQDQSDTNADLNELQSSVELGGQLCKELAKAASWIDTSQEVVNRHVREFGIDEERSRSYIQQLDIDKATLIKNISSYKDRVEKVASRMNSNVAMRILGDIEAGRPLQLPWLIAPYDEAFLKQVVILKAQKIESSATWLSDCKSIKIN
jgi:serine/threonine protein kinase